ncbi:F0F1 ATP synthase subunit gamma [bacterium]|nr:F0F1 ATP synthase subunit gamma [bacterium]
MATLRDIKKRISSVKNTQKITRAMKMVAASKLRRAQQSLLGHRPFANHLNQIVNDVMSRSYDGFHHPLTLRKQETKKIDALVYSSNRGLCAGFNSNLLRFTETWLHKKETSKKQINLHMIGRKGRDFFKARKIDLKNVHLDYAECLTMNQATELAEKAITDFLSGDIDSYYIIYNTQSCGVYTVSRKRIKIYHGGHIR